MAEEEKKNEEDKVEIPKPPTTPDVPQVETEKVDTTDTFLGDQTSLDTDISLDPKQVTDTFQIEAPKPTSGIGQIDSIESVATKIGQFDAEQVDSRKAYVEAVQGKVSDKAVAEAITGELDERATTQYQLSQLLSRIEEGKPLPPWASPAARKVAGVMQSRGLGKSSLAAAAIVQSIMESGIPIAKADADQFARLQLTNLNNQNRAALQNAAVVAAMDRANLNARMQAAVANGQALLKVDIANLNARQRAAEIEYSTLNQALFKDAAEENARKQFNAKSELQVEQFFAELGVSVDNNNANRAAAIEQFNISEQNAMAQYNLTLQDTRERFNSNMQFAVDQSNAVWRRELNTFETAQQNETNRFNVQLQFNADQNDLNNHWQLYRDKASWNFQKAENKQQRMHELGMLAMEFANAKSLYSRQQKDQLSLAIGTWISTWIGS